MRKIVLSAVLTMAMALPALAHFPPGEFLFAVQFPDANIPVIDGNHADWGVVPQVPYEIGNDRYSDSVYSKLRGEIDVSDLSVRQVVGWNDDTNLIYLMAEVFDNVHSRDAETPNAWWADDAWETGGIPAPSGPHRGALGAPSGTVRRRARTPGAARGASSWRAPRAAERARG